MDIFRMYNLDGEFWISVDHKVLDIFFVALCNKDAEHLLAV